jgi:hypothetical protein
MGSLATTTIDDASSSPLFPRVGDDELGQRIALALRERRPTLDMEPLFAGRYRLERLISRDAELERHDAIRVVDGRWVTLEMPVDADPQVRERFTRCARQQCRLRHPHAMYALDHGVGPDGVPYLVREALDTESLAQMLAREGSVTWTRARSMALQICNVVTAARELGLVPTDLSLEGCRRARHGRAVDDIRLVEWRELETLTPDERDERAAVFAIARIVEELVAGYGPRGEVGTNPHVVAPPPAELGDVLARGRSLVPSARYATVEQLGLAIAQIGDDLGDELGPRRPTPAHGDTRYAVHTTPRRRSRPIEQPAEIQCLTAAVFVEPTKPSAQPTVDAAAPVVQRRRTKWPWYMLGTMVAACAVHVLVPSFWPGVAAQAQGGIEVLRDAVQGREPLEAPPAAAEEASDPEPPAPAVVEAPPTPAPVVAPPIVVDRSALSAAVPPAPVVAAMLEEPIARPRPKAKKVATPRPVAAPNEQASEQPIEQPIEQPVEEPIEPIAAAEPAPVAEIELPVVTAAASPEIPEPHLTKLPTPPLRDTPPAIDVPAPEGEMPQ